MKDNKDDKLDNKKRKIEFRGKNNKWAVYWEFEKYGVNKDGQVCSFDYNHTGMTGVLKQYKDRDGYMYVYLKIEGKRYKRLVHRMILSTFIDNPLNKPQVNHKNGIRNDNRLENLEWVTAQENCVHSYRCNGRKPTEKQKMLSSQRFSKENNPKCKINESIASLIRNDRKNGMYLKDLANKYNLSVSHCSVICLNKFWSEGADESRSN